MFHLNANLAVYLHRGKVDFRKNINGLCAVVEHDLGLNPFAHAVFVFGNRRKDRIKILGWNRNGFWLLQKRLEDARFVSPRCVATRLFPTKEPHKKCVVDSDWKGTF